MIVRAGHEYKNIIRTGESIASIYRGHDLIWTAATIRDDFNVDGWLNNWVNELWLGDLGRIFADGFGRLVDGLGNFVGQTVAFVTDLVSMAANGIGKLVSNVGQGLADAYCGAWGGTAAPNGLVGMVNNIPIIGPGLATWLTGSINITKMLGQIPIIGDIGRMIGLIPNAVSGLLSDPINFIVNGIGDVIGKLTCGAFRPQAGGDDEAVGYVIGKSGGAARLLVPDGLLSLNTVYSRMRHPLKTLTDDGHLDIRIAQPGSPGLGTQVFRRFSNNGTATAGVGLDIRDNRVGIVRRTGGNNTVVVPGITEYGPGTRLYLKQTGDLHQLWRDGIPVGEWDDVGQTATKGVNNRSVAMVMAGSKQLFGTRRFSPSLDYIEAA